MSRVAGGTDRAAFFESGRQSVRDLQAVLGIAGRRLESFGEILDFGCGCGRILVHLEHLAATSRVHGVDIDARAVRWAAENLPWADIKVNRTEPPLDFADATFDLVYNHSVFTHLDEEHQDLWLAELRRVTRPGGLVVLTVHGEKALWDFEEGSKNAGGNPSLVRDEVRRRGISFLKNDSHVGGPHNDGYHSTFHAPWYVLDHWSGFFTVKAYVLQGSLDFQDVVLLQRRRDDQPVPAGTRPIAEPVVAPSSGIGAASLPDVDRAVHDPLYGPAPEAPGRFGALTRIARKTVLRAIAHYADYQRTVDQGVQRALWSIDAALVEVNRELERIQAAERVNGLLTLNESNVRLWDSLNRHGERINRLEEDLWAAIDTKADKDATAEVARNGSAAGDVAATGGDGR
ncbi:MAG TPA: class I SAM-dependent methyltransferase [Acidimicrobiales bacterium]|nr:class I SAM-dependent methyltransferase [Acidimicrobiales bacterium]